MKRSALFALALFSTLFLFATSSYAASTRLFVEGRLTTATGAYLPSGNYSVTFNIYSSETATTPLWSDTFPTQAVGSSGTFKVTLGSQKALPTSLLSPGKPALPYRVSVFTSSARWLDVKVAEEAFGPRIKINPAAYASDADTLDGKDSSFFSPATHRHSVGKQNTAIGEDAFKSNTTGYRNTAIGYRALATNTTGLFNIALGDEAGDWPNGNFTGQHNIYIDSHPHTADESNTIRIGSTNMHKRVFIGGIYGSNIGSEGMPVCVNGQGQLGQIASSIRYKQEIEDMGNASNGLMELRPVTFRYKPEYDEGPRTIQYGLIAEEVAEVYPDLVKHDPETGQPYTVSYHLVNAMLLNEVQKQHKELSALKERLAKLEALLNK
ncbi:MAG: tail fiber domain-containing protein [Syntrophobacteraceae bacterium]